jgi:hypothetical protein
MAAEIGKAMAAELGPPLGNMLGQAIGALPQQIAQGMAQVLQQVPVRTTRLCAPCLTARIAWNAAHEADIQAALTSAALAAGIIEGGELPMGDPQAARLNIAPYLPARLRPGAGPDAMPPLEQSVTTAGGTEVCPGHLPDAPQRAGRRPLLIPGTGLSVATLARLAATGGITG